MSLNIWDIMAPAFFECLILVGIHSYLGIHVIKRKVIFVDLALAQVAALGTTVGFLFGIMPGTVGAYWFSLGFAILGAAIFSISRFRNEKIPQEAVIGLVYALAAAIAILVIDKAPHGAEHIKELLTGSILWVKWSTIFHAALVYSAVGLFHFIFRDKFLLISNNPEQAYRQGISVRLWDFLFYVSFGIVITHSVGTAGVLLVFVFLVVPAITSIMITDVLWKQLAIGWSMGLVVSVIGLYISYVADLPSGPTVVALYGLMLLIVALILYVLRAQNRRRALLRIALGLVATVLIALVFKLMAAFFNHSGHEHAHEMAAEHADRVATSEMQTTDPMPVVDENRLARLSDPDSLQFYFEHSTDDMVRLQIAEKLVALDRKKGLRLLLKLLSDCPFPLIREEAIVQVEKYAHTRFGYDSALNCDQNRNALEKLRQWYRRTYGKQ